MPFQRSPNLFKLRIITIIYAIAETSLTRIRKHFRDKPFYLITVETHRYIIKCPEGLGKCVRYNAGFLNILFSLAI